MSSARPAGHYEFDTHAEHFSLYPDVVQWAVRLYQATSNYIYFAPEEPLYLYLRLHARAVNAVATKHRDKAMTRAVKDARAAGDKWAALEAKLSPEFRDKIKLFRDYRCARNAAAVVAASAVSASDQKKKSSHVVVERTVAEAQFLHEYEERVWDRLPESRRDALRAIALPPYDPVPLLLDMRDHWSEWQAVVQGPDWGPGSELNVRALLAWMKGEGVRSAFAAGQLAEEAQRDPTRRQAIAAAFKEVL